VKAIFLRSPDGKWETTSSTGARLHICCGVVLETKDRVVAVNFVLGRWRFAIGWRKSNYSEFPNSSI
jgi:hypothetical protein